MRHRARVLVLVCCMGLAAGLVHTTARAAGFDASTTGDFFAYAPNFGGGVYVATGDFDGDGTSEVVTGAGQGGGPHVRVLAGGAGSLHEVASFFAYAPGFTGGVRVAAADVDGDGKDELITGAGPGGGPHVRVLEVNVATHAVTEFTSFFAYSPLFTGGVFVAGGDADGSGGSPAKEEIVTGAGAGGGPHVRVLSLYGTTVSVEREFFAYDTGFTGGVSVAVANTDSDARTEVVTGAGPGGGPHVRVIDAFSGAQAGFFAYSASFTGGVFVAGGDLDGDGRAEVVTGPGAGGGPHLRTFGVSGATATPGGERFVYGTTFAGGVRPAVRPMASGPQQIVTGPGGGGGPHVRLLDHLVHPTVTVSVLRDDLELPWDLAEAPDGTLVVTQRGSGLWAHRPDDTLVSLAQPDDLWASGETGMMGVDLDPGFGTSNRYAYTCEGHQEGGNPVDIRVVRWDIASDWSTATRGPDVVTGLPVTTGRHGGCRVRFVPDTTNVLMVTTGDAATCTNPQDLHSLGGKTLRVLTDAADPNTPAPDNPFVDDPDPNTRLLYTYGHRNPQGLAFRPDTTKVYDVEHGSDRDDEVNELVAGGNYGWTPGCPGYDESQPMTNPAIPGVRFPVWSSGFPTLATSGATFLDGSGWRGWNGSLVVATLKASHLMVLHPDPDGRFVEQADLLADHGRLRTPRLSRDGSKLYVTTSNGTADEIIVLTPS